MASVAEPDGRAVWFVRPLFCIRLDSTSTFHLDLVGPPGFEPGTKAL